ncbi:MAG: ABC transporter ATP-binding protein [Asgard group archaeon]|nr:ABC transporter ATP-binding protein [Asgard group archaeon]
MTLLEVKNLKTYFHTKGGSVKAVDNVSFKLGKGEVLGLAGESGCGKTTTCLSIMQMVDFPGEIMEGQIMYENAFEVIDEDRKKSLRDRILNRNPGNEKRTRNLLEFSEAEMRRIRGNHISMVFQGAMNALNPVHRVGNQILEVLNIHEPELEKEDAWDKVIDILETVGIDSARARDYPHQLSGGMKQRALIAMALVNNPDIVIADEPVTALDVIVQSQVLKATKELQRKFDLSMIMITHDLSVIAEVCETLAIMYAGKLVEYGDLRTLFKEPFHPYTQALINAFPSITGPKKDLFDIGGSPPDLRNPPEGCRFHPRCPKVMPICSKKIPSETPIKNGFVACWLYEEEEK